MKDWNWETIFCGQYRSIFNHCNVIDQQSYRIRRKETQNKGYYAVHGHSRSSRTVSIESLYATYYYYYYQTSYLIPFQSYRSLFFKYWTLCFWATLWGHRDNVRCSSQAHWKARNGLSIGVNWTFFAKCYGWGATSQHRFKIGDFAPKGASWPKMSGRRGGRPPTNHSSSQKTRLNDHSYGIKIWTDLSSIFSQFTHLTDRQMNGQTPFSSLVSAGIPCSTEIKPTVYMVTQNHWL